MDDPATFIGIDVAKGWLDVAQRPGGRAWRVSNDEAGWAELVACLAPVAAPLIVLEASGGYEVGVAMALDAAGTTPVVLNPVSARRFAQSLGRRAKTDRLDAALLAEYAERLRPTPRPLPAQTVRTLKELLARRGQLTKHLVEEQNRRRQASALLAPQIETLIALLTTQRAEIDALLASVVASDPDWQARVAQLDTVPGFGVLTATLLAVGLGELGRCTGKEAAALVGVAPYPKESGARRSARCIGGGRAALRHALYEAATTTVRCDPTLRAHHAQLRARGKTYKEATIACLRRLLGIVTAMVRDGLTWQETKVGRGLFAPPTA